MRRIVAIACALVALAGACSGKKGISTPTTTPTLSLPASPSAIATAKKKPKTPVARYAVYALDNVIGMYDVANDTVQEIARGDGVRLPKFVNEHEISFVQGNSPAVVRLIDLKTKAVRDLVSEDGGIAVYGWSPDRQTLAYVTTDAQDYPHLVFWRAGADAPVQPVATLARAFGRELLASDQLKIEFGSDGQEVLIVYTPADGAPEDDLTPEQSQFQVRVDAGGLAYAAGMDDGPTMGVWSKDGTRVYYRTDRGARVWDANTGRVQGVAGGTRWFNPVISPSGALLAYDTGEDSSAVRVRVLTLRSGATQVVSKAGRFHPVFASSKRVWVQAIKRCDSCEGPTQQVRAVYAIDIGSSSERRLALPVLTGVDVLYR